MLNNCLRGIANILALKERNLRRSSERVFDQRMKLKDHWECYSTVTARLQPA